MSGDSDSRLLAAPPADQQGWGGVTGQPKRHRRSQPIASPRRIGANGSRDPLRLMTDSHHRGFDLMCTWIDETNTWRLDFEGQERRSAMRTAYRAKTKHRRRNR